LRRSVNFLGMFFLSFVNQTQSQLNNVNDTMYYGYDEFMKANEKWSDFSLMMEEQKKEIDDLKKELNKSMPLLAND